jgi:hypothetical protein
MRLPARGKNRGRNPKVKIFSGKTAVLLTRHLDRLAFDLAQEWSEDRTVIPYFQTL